MRERLDNFYPDTWISGLAARQHGAVSTARLLAAGIGHDGIRRRVQAGRLHRIHRGVYAVGYRNLSHEGCSGFRTWHVVDDPRFVAVTVGALLHEGRAPS
jgi:hypothetical protein